MRKKIHDAYIFGNIDISEIEIDPRSRDEIPKLLSGLKYLYCNNEIREKVFETLEEMISPKIDKNNGRPGMELWTILVLGILRLNCNWDYDKLKEITDHHDTVRMMIGLNGWMDKTTISLQTLKDNIRLFTPEILKKINKIVVQEGLKLVLKKNEKIEAQCDSFVVETNVHYPTDTNLLFDSIRKAIETIAKFCQKEEIKGWRQWKKNIKQIKKALRIIQKTRYSTSKDEEKKNERKLYIKKLHTDYIQMCYNYFEKVENTLSSIKNNKLLLQLQINNYIQFGKIFCEQIERRVINGEKIPHDEKIFSIFEQHTEWISKGKAGVPQQLGLRVCIIKENHGFILNHEVMVKMTDEKLTLSLIIDTKKDYPELHSCSFDKGFYTPENKIKSKEELDVIIMPKKGRLNKLEFEEEHSDEFLEKRRKHSSVEAAISTLQNHGLDRCPDHELTGFKRYVSLAILGRNIQTLGHFLQQKELKKIKKKAA